MKSAKTPAKTPCILVKSASVLMGIPELKSKSQSVTVPVPQL